MAILLAILLSSTALTISGPGFEQELTIEDLGAFPEEEIALFDLGEESAGSLIAPDLLVVLAELGVDTAVIEEIVLRSSDGYRANLLPALLSDCRILLLHTLTGTPFEASGPIYSVMPGCPVMLWVRDLREVEVLYSSPSNSLTAVHVVAPRDILSRAAPVEMDGMTFWGLSFSEFSGDRGRVEVRSRDGLRRRYSAEELSSEGWMIADYHGLGFDLVAETVPRGVWMRDVELIVQADEAFFFPPDIKEGDPPYRLVLGDMFPNLHLELNRLEILAGSLTQDFHFKDPPSDLSDIVFEVTKGASLRVLTGNASFENVVRISFQ